MLLFSGGCNAQKDDKMALLLVLGALLPSRTTSIYAEGFSRNGSGVGVPGYWKNGVWIGLTPLDSAQDSFVYSLVVVK